MGDGPEYYCASTASMAVDLADYDSLLSQRDELLSLLIEAEALLCDERAGTVCHELAGRIRLALARTQSDNRNEVNP